MPGQKHVFVAIKGGYNDSALTAEAWQVGVRLWADSSVPTDTGTFPTTGSFSADSASGTNADGAAASNWKWQLAGGTVFAPIPYLLAVSGPVKTFFQNAIFSSKSVVKQITVYPWEDGSRKAWDGRSATYTFTTPPAGGSASTMMPLECSIVCSWKTDTPGRRGRGRIYLPGLVSVALDPKGFVVTSTTNTIGDAAAVLLDGLNLEDAVPTNPHTKPCVTGYPYTNYQVIKKVRVGNVWDAQRRRRKSLPETYYEKTVTYA